MEFFAQTDARQFKASFPLDKRKSNKIKRSYITIRLDYLNTTCLSMPGGM
jgi:hypothetical protein